MHNISNGTYYTVILFYNANGQNKIYKNGQQ